MPYIMVMGGMSSLHLSKDDGVTVYGLRFEEREGLVRELNESFGKPMASLSEPEHTVRVAQRGGALLVVNRLHALLGYDLVSHAMVMTNANREMVSFTMYKKTGKKPAPPHGSVVTLAKNALMYQLVMLAEVVNMFCSYSPDIFSRLETVRDGVWCAGANR